MNGDVWCGDDEHMLCSKACADAWSEDNYDCDCDADGYFQCSGFIGEGYEPSPGDVCAWCKKEIPVMKLSERLDERVARTGDATLRRFAREARILEDDAHAARAAAATQHAADIDHIDTLRHARDTARDDAAELEIDRDHWKREAQALGAELSRVARTEGEKP